MHLFNQRVNFIIDDTAKVAKIKDLPDEELYPIVTVECEENGTVEVLPSDTMPYDTQSIDVMDHEVTAKGDTYTNNTS